MAPQNFKIIFARSAVEDLAEILEYWTNRGEQERGEQYAEDLPSEAVRQLSNPSVARSGRYLRESDFPQAQQMAVFKRSYRILYFVDEEKNEVQVIRFWHSHRAEPFRGEDD